MNEYLGEFPTFKRGDWTPKDWVLCYIQAYGGIDIDQENTMTDKPLASLPVFREDAIALLDLLPRGRASLEPCHEANPALWHHWCRLRGRDPASPSLVWSELDVAVSSALMLRAHIDFIGME